MANISDVIEKFILDAMQHEQSLQISRNELANFFSCAPSQINYVLATRFSNERGFDVSSQRGGGGFIKLTKIVANNANNFMFSIVNNILNKPIDFITAKKLVLNLKDNKCFDEDQTNVIMSAISPKALNCPIDFADMLRSQVLKSILIDKIKHNDKGGM